MLAVCVCVCECAEAVDARVFDAVSSHACRCVAPRAVEARAEGPKKIQLGISNSDLRLNISV
jgi:hypothetical protein